MKIYYYCERCLKPIDPETRNDDNNSLDICKSCATELLVKIFGEKND